MDEGTHDVPPPIAWASTALRDVAAERRRQIEAEGWTPEHDDATHMPGEMALAACCYCVADEGEAPPAVWPWATKWWKPKDRRRNMVRAAALLLAEIERMDRNHEQNNADGDYRYYETPNAVVSGAPADAKEQRHAVARPLDIRVSRPPNEGTAR